MFLHLSHLLANYEDTYDRASYNEHINELKIEALLYTSEKFGN